jgi:hypothetical protein
MRKLEIKMAREIKHASGLSEKVAESTIGSGASSWQLAGSMELIEPLEEDPSEEATEMTNRLAKTLKILFE